MVVVVDKKQIASNIVDFYQGLLDSSANTLVGIDVQISCEQALDLIRPI